MPGYYFTADRQLLDSARALSERTNVTVSDMLRESLRRLQEPKVWNEILPQMSGRLVEEKR